MGRVSLKSCVLRYLRALRPINISVNNTILSPNELLKGKVAIVTGGSRGIGYAICETFIRYGATVVAIAKTKENLEKAAKSQNSSRYIPYQCDITDIDNISAHIDKIQEITGSRIDVLVNSAGIKNGQDERFWMFTEKDFNDVINVNVKAPYFWSREIIKRMLEKQTKGHIINVIGIKGDIPEASPYSISKFGLKSITQGMARMFADKGIVINAISPGATKTDMCGIKGDNMLHLATANMRLADPKEIANIAVFLASDMANNMVGSVVVSDGGEMLQYGNQKF